MSPADLDSRVVPFPESVFMLGMRYEDLAETVRAADRRRHLGVRAILDGTPPAWIHLPSFSLGKRLVTNAEYLEFLESSDEGGARLVDGAALWRHVWQDLNYRQERPRVTFERAPGEIVEFEEDYTGARGALEAYLSSLRFEIQRVMLVAGAEGAADGPLEHSRTLVLRERGEAGRETAAPREELVRPAFAVVKHLLRGSLLLPGEDGFTLLSDREERLIAGLPDPAAAAEILTGLVGELRKAYRHRVDRRYLMPLQSGHFPLEPIDFLLRLREQAKRLPSLDQPVSLREVWYPRYWPSPRGPSGHRGFPGAGVPWEEQPLTGITLYEAAAYAAWLARGTGRRVGLPSEAEVERAASWPSEGLPPAGQEIVLDPSRKLAFPWQDHNPSRDFHAYFGREGAGLADYYLKDRRRWEELLEETSRVVEGGRRILQLEGFGWQWTRDRFNEQETKWSRFQDADYPRWTGRPARLKGKEDVLHPVYDWQVSGNPGWLQVVLRGSPEIVGGPGLACRRYAANPFRAYPNVGFRVAVEEA
jgi:formylglycine-generating enzyme required for sulfatase activity